MKNSRIYTEEKSAAFKAALNEKNFVAEDLIEEVIPLLEDYFICNFFVNKSYILMKFLNGQKFKLKIEKA